MDMIHYYQGILFSETAMRNYVFMIIFSWCLSLNAESQLAESNEAVIRSHEYFSYALSVPFHHCIILICHMF
jgi:hypothetical protein